MITWYVVTLHVNIVMHRVRVKARSHEEAFNQALEMLQIEYSDVDRAEVKPTLKGKMK